MAKIRAFLRDFQSLAAVVLFVALLVKAVVPAGFMLGPDSKILTVQYCGEVTGSVSAKQVTIPMEQVPDGPTGDHIASAAICAFASLAADAIGAADNPTLPTSLHLVSALESPSVFAPNVPPPFYIIPPLRGPPIYI